MERWIVVSCLALALLWAAHLASAWQFRRQAQRMADEIGQGGDAPPRDDLPVPVLRFAMRGLAGQAPAAGRILLEQAAEMELRPGAGWQAIAARQVIGVTEPGFVWEAWAKIGVLVLVRVVDAFTARRGRLEVRLLGSIPVARAEGADLDRSEAMRYLAELPWAPDAILLNRELDWKVLENGEIEVRLGMSPRDASVRFALDAAGDIVTMRGTARYAGDDRGRPVYRDWEGHFSDYGRVGGRRIPRRGEVGNIVDGAYRAYWRGRILRWRIM